MVQLRLSPFCLLQRATVQVVALERCLIGVLRSSLLEVTD